MKGLNLIIGVILFILMINGNSESNSPTKCEICALTGDCNKAYREQPGQYCGSYQKHGFNEVCCCGVHQICGSPEQDQQCECISILFKSLTTIPIVPESENQSVAEFAITFVGGTIRAVFLIFISMGTLSTLYILAEFVAYCTDLSARRANILRAWRNRQVIFNKIVGIIFSICLFCANICMNAGVIIKRNVVL
ncbi:hypothetical protein THRCLA_00661 [Thraustotheca clavata]|uniref:Uncharacterized protein n=1 Tax=Thraustotheca clavata TaxID=74557 RepID=A0A1W0AAL6_9STRA|nr:hypothetical protein THRCLA_00661 [Thraustotheca clavata]